jgi:hypothetical protein
MTVIAMRLMLIKPGFPKEGLSMHSVLNKNPHKRYGLR